MNRLLATLVAVTIVSTMSGVSVASAEIPEEVKIGGIFDKNWAEGDESSRIAEIAVDDFNEYLSAIGADWTLSISLEDAQSKNAIALEKIQAFNSAGIDILVGVAFSSHIQLAAGYIDTNDILVLSHASQATNLAIDDSVFRLVSPDVLQAQKVAEMLEDAGIEVLVPVIRADTWGIGMVNDVKTYYDGTVTDGFPYDPDISEFSATVSLLDDTIRKLVEEHGADKIGVLYVGTDEFLLMVQQMEAYENVFDVRWFGTNTQSLKTYFFEDDAAIKFADATQFTATSSIPLAINDIKRSIDAKYMDMYNATISTYGYASYDSIWLLGNTILQTQSVDTNVLTNAIPHVAAHMQGSSGDLTLTEYGDLVGSKFVIKQIQDGAWVELTEE